MNGAIKGVSFLIISNVAFCGMSCLVKYGTELSAPLATMFRFIIGMGVIGIGALTGRMHLTFVDKSGLFFRGLFGGIAISTGFLSIAKLGLIKASIIIYTYPLFASFFSLLILKEQLTFRKMIALSFSFLGVILVMTDRGGIDSASFLDFGLYELITIAGAILAGLSSVFVKKLQSTDSSPTIFFAQCLIGFWIIVIPAGQGTGINSYKGSILLLLIGLLAAFGQLILTEGYRYISVSTGAVIVLLSPVMNMFAGAVFFKEAVTVRMVLGAVIILVSSSLLMMHGKKQKRYCSDNGSTVPVR